MTAQILVAFLICSFGALLHSSEVDRVTLVRTPDGGIQPQAAIDERGVIHLIYFKGESMGGDIFYVRREPAQDNFSKPLRVNRKPGSAIAAGTIRGAQLALGRNGRVHVAWNGLAPAKGKYMEAPMQYTRLNDAGTEFEPERNVITFAGGLDGGGSIAADRSGNVFVMWHAPQPGNTSGEKGRAVFVARSKDDGTTFAREQLAVAKSTGACGCCGMKAFADSRGNVYAFFRAAATLNNRDETLLISRNGGENFEVAFREEWNISTCPMSSAFLSETKNGVLAAGEARGRVFFVRIDPASGKVSEPISPEAKAKHPVAIGNEQGQVLLIWTEGTAWAKGGSVAWQIFDRDGKATSAQGRVDGVPAWSLATAVAKPDGNFVVIY